VPRRAQHPAAHYLNGRAALDGPHLGASAVGGMVVRRLGDERKRRVGLDWIDVAVPRHRLHRLPARTRRLALHLALVVNEVLTVGALPPNGRTTELGLPYIKYKGSLAHFGCISPTAMSGCGEDCSRPCG